MCANAAFTAIYIPAILFPKVKWLVMPTALLGFGQTFAHGVPRREAGTRPLGPASSA